MGEWEGRGALPLVAGGGINADTELVFGLGAGRVCLSPFLRDATKEIRG